MTSSRFWNILERPEEYRKLGQRKGVNWSLEGVIDEKGYPSWKAVTPSVTSLPDWECILRSPVLDHLQMAAPSWGHQSLGQLEDRLMTAEDLENYRRPEGKGKKFPNCTTWKASFQFSRPCVHPFPSACLPPSVHPPVLCDAVLPYKQALPEAARIPCFPLCWSVCFLAAQHATW